MASPNYSIPEMPETGWKSNSGFSYKLISGTYNAAKNNLESIWPNYEDVESCKINPDPLDGNWCEQNDPDVNDILADFNGAASYVGIWLSLAVIFTIVGIVWCIFNKCKCCRSKHRKSNDLDYLVSTNADDDLRLGQYGSRKKKLVWKVVVGVLMGLWIIGLMYSVFMSFASNESLRSSIFELPDDAKDALDDGDRYLDTTKRQLSDTFIKSFDQLAEAIREIDLPPNKNNIDMTQVETSVQKLADKLSTVEHNHVDVDIHHDSPLSGLSHALESLKSTLQTEISPLIVSLSDARMTRQQPIEDAIANAKRQLDSNCEDLIAAMNEVSNDTMADVWDLIEDAETDWLDITGSAIYGTFMGFNLILLLMLISIILGSIMVWVGKGSTQSTGFIFSRFSVVLMFIFGWFITCVMVSQFAIAGFFVEYACVGVRNMEVPNGEFPNTGCNAVRNNDDYVLPSYPHVIQNCKNNEAAYPAFCLETVVDISSISNISDYFNNLSTMEWDSSLEASFQQAQSSLVNGSRLLQSNTREVEEYVKRKNDTDMLELFEQLLGHWKTFTDDFMSFANSKQNPEPIIQLVDDYERFVETQLRSEIGKCGPIYNAVNSSIHNVCYKIFVPVTTYWWALQFLLFMIVAIIITELISERVF